MWTKEQILANATSMLNKPENPWEVKVENDQIIATWKWMDATFFSPTQISEEVKQFKFIVTLLDNGKWKEKDIINESTASVNGNGLNLNKSFFVGKSFNKSVTIGLGKNNDTGDVGVQKFSFDSTKIKEPIRDFLKNCGWKKKGFF